MSFVFKQKAPKAKKMDPDFTNETCFTCCNIPVNFHKISDSDGDSSPNIRHIICQHFWFTEDDLRSAIVCETCWEKVEQFHQFYLDVKKYHEHRVVAPLSMFIKQEEINIEETQFQENYIDISAESQNFFDTVDCKLEISEECDEQSKKQEPSELFPQPRKKSKHVRFTLSGNLLNAEKRQTKEDFIKQHTRYICDECNIEFENFREIKNHRMEKHNKTNVMCCGNQYRTRGELYQHVQSFLNPEAFKCEICGTTFKSKYIYVRHKEMFHAAEEDLVFKCTRCPKSFIKKGLLKTHLTEHETLENETAKCEFCGKCFRTRNILNRHVKSVHKEPTDFICEVCSKGFYLRAMFLEHIETHELTAEQLKEKCTCEVCGHLSSNVKSLKRHMKYMHAPDAQLKEQCPVCNKCFKSHSHLLQHMRLHKEGECKCEVCGHVSNNAMSLKRHMNYMHAPDRKRHVCEQCGKECLKAVMLKEHIAIAHTREHLLQCDYCEKKFFSSAYRNSHRKKYHPQEWLEDRMPKYSREEEISVGGETVS